MLRRISTPVWLFGLWVLCLGLVTPALADDPAPTAVVEGFHAALLANMKAGKSLNFEGRRDRLRPVITTAFDLPAMARVSTGGAWAKMSDEQHQQIVDAFTDWTVATYAGNFKDWDGESFTTKGQTDDGKGNVVVETKLILKGDPPVTFSYRLRKSGDAWKVIDIYLEGAVSQIAMHRGEFAAALSFGGVPNLLKHMQDLTAQAKKDGV